MTGLELLASGRDADVFALDEERVLRRYRRGGDVDAEAAVMVHLAEAGFPVPVVHDAQGPDLVLERLRGRTLLHEITAGATDVDVAAEILAGLHRRLHQVRPPRGVSPSDRILHLDLHADNVMMTDRGPVLIDWRNSREGPPEVDVAMTVVILAQVAVDPVNPLRDVAEAGLVAFVQILGAETLVGLDDALTQRRTDSGLTATEVEQFDSAGALARRRLRSATRRPGDR